MSESVSIDLLSRLDRVGVHQSVAARYCKEAAEEIRRLQSALVTGDPGDAAQHCRPDYLQWEQRITCLHCAKPLADNQLVKDAHKMNTVNGWAKGQLHILADMAEHRGMQWFADEARKIAGGLLHL